MRQIDIAWFECSNCGHRSTPPESINATAAQMENYQIIEPNVKILREEGKSDVITKEPAIDKKDEDQYKQDIKDFHTGNNVSIETISDKTTIIKMERSYAIAEHDKTELAESDHIVLKCPACSTKLYEVRW